jgi:hypothetical protein
LAEHNLGPWGSARVHWRQRKRRCRSISGHLKVAPSTTRTARMSKALDGTSRGSSYWRTSDGPSSRRYGGRRQLRNRSGRRRRTTNGKSRYTDGRHGRGDPRGKGRTMGREVAFERDVSPPGPERSAFEMESPRTRAVALLVVSESVKSSTLFRHTGSRLSVTVNAARARPRARRVARLGRDLGPMGFHRVLHQVCPAPDAACPRHPHNSMASEPTSSVSAMVASGGNGLPQVR